MKGIYEFYWDCGRSGELSGIFVADSLDVGRAIGSNIYLGEVLGKHSDIKGILDAADINLKCKDSLFVAYFEEIFGQGYSMGINPVAHFLESEVDVADVEEL